MFLNLSVGVSYYLGRIFNVIAYCILALIAIKLSGKAKQLDDNGSDVSNESGSSCFL